jgi:release factor glutamine methyltransferase
MPNTYNDIYLEARKNLKAAGIREYSLEARIILSTAANKSKEEFIRDAQLYVAKDYTEKVDALIARRLAGEPVAYITGEWEFYGMPLIITKDVLIPRSDTELLVSTAVELLKGKSDLRILDLCAGSGCIGLALAKELTGARVVLVDNSNEAIKVCKMNVLQNRMTQRVTCLLADIKEHPPMLIGSFDMIVSNPPYISSTDIAGLDREVREYEPLAALDGGRDGLNFYRYLAMNWHKALKPNSYVAVECGIGQAQEVRNIFTQKNFIYYKTIKDTQGIERVVIAKQI